MPIVCGIKFRGTGKVYFFDPGQEALEKGDPVIVETARGRELGQVTQGNHEIGSSEVVGELKPVVRRATTIDLLESQRYQHREDAAKEKCRDQVERFGLPMKIVNAEYNFDGSRLTFFFTSEQRVDFRELVRELAHIFKTRIELRQIGVRDEAKILGGLGKCGRPLCCATWLSEFTPVSIRMAKQQNLPLSPMEISGLCGRLLCCLVYENSYYKSVASRFPKVGKIVETPYGPGKVVKVSVLRETVNLLMEDGSTVEFTSDQLAGRAPLETADDGPSAVQQQALDAALPPSQPDPSSRQASRQSPQNPQSRSSRGRSSRRRRSKRPRRPSTASPSDGSGDAKQQGSSTPSPTPRTDKTGDSSAGAKQSDERRRSPRRRSRRRRRPSGSAKASSDGNQSQSSRPSGD